MHPPIFEAIQKYDLNENWLNLNELLHAWTDMIILKLFSFRIIIINTVPQRNEFEK
jgi:hypothetical protein